jgi:hypothetical protein
LSGLLLLGVLATARLLRVFYAAAVEGDFSMFFLKSIQHKFCCVSSNHGAYGLLLFLKLKDIITGACCDKNTIQFLRRSGGVFRIRNRQKDRLRCGCILFRSSCFIGFVYVLFQEQFLKDMRYAAVLIVIGLVLYFIRALKGGLAI